MTERTHPTPTEQRTPKVRFMRVSEIAQPLSGSIALEADDYEQFESCMMTLSEPTPAMAAAAARHRAFTSGK